MATAGDSTVSALQYILKTKYDQKKLYELTYPDCAFLGSVRKDLKFGGNNARITLRYGRPQGGSMVFGTAQTNKTSSSDVGMLLTRAKDYHICGITGEALLAGEGSENTLISAVNGEMEGCTLNFRRSLSVQLYANGGGARSQFDGVTSIASKTMPLLDAQQIVFFEVGQWCVLATTDGTTGSVEANHEQISAVDRDAGKISATSAAWNTVITTAANTDYIFREGDFGVAIKGLEAWIPATAPASGDSFFGVDRSVDTTRLAGVRFAASTGAAKEDTLVDCSARLGREGGIPDTVYLQNLDRADIVKNLAGKAVFDMTKATDGSVGYKALILEGDKAPIKVVVDPNQKKGRFHMLQLDTWVLKSLKGVPHFIDEDGNKLLREATSDGFEWRMRALWQLGCEAPGYNARGAF
jgi:hypothetical protein